MKAVQFAAILDGIATKKDGSFKVVIETQELAGSEAAALLSYRQQVGYVTFTPNAVKEVDIPKEDAEVGQKTPSKRLRAVLHILWEQRGKKGTSDEFYRSKMEQIIEGLKEQLE